MNSLTTKVTDFDPGLCRCCGFLTKYRLINERYHNAGREVVYSNIIKECFGIELAKLHGDPSDRLICGPCMNKLLDAWSFCSQLRAMENKFRDDNIDPLLAYSETHSSKEVQCDIIKSSFSKDIADAGPQAAKNTISIECDEVVIDDSEDEISTSDGLDEELTSEQLKEYKLLVSGFDSHDTDSCSDDSLIWSPDDDMTQVIAKPKKMKKTSHRVEKEDSSGTDDALITDPKNDTSQNAQPDKLLKKIPDYIDELRCVENATTIVRYSYVCPFKNRFNHLLCYYCQEYFLDPALLRRHTLSHSVDDFKHAVVKNKGHRLLKLDITRIDCRLCSDKIDNIDDFKQHLVKVHKIRHHARSRDGVIPFRLVHNVNMCTVCGEMLPQFYALVRHMDQHYSNFVCENCGIGFVEEKMLQTHMLAHDGKRLPCNLCGKALKSEYTLMCHKKRMHGNTDEMASVSDLSDEDDLPLKKKKEEDVPCQGCDKIFKTRKLWSVHVRKAHMNHKHACQVCGQKFFTRFALNNHMPTHTGERNFKCSECGKSYPRLKTLKEHMRIHNNDRRYRCDICGQSFIQNCSLKGHMKSKHADFIR